jgi:hypothetical protein
MKKQSDLIEEYFENNLNVYCKNITAINNFSDVTVLRLCEGKGLEALNFKLSTND